MSEPENQPMPAVSRHDDATLLGAAGMGPPRAVGTVGSLPGYDVLKVIGAGGMGVVLLARELGTGELVAVKIIRPELAHLRNVVHRFLVEARHLSRLQHPNIIRVRGISDSESCAFYSMQYFPRGALSRHIDPTAGLPKEGILRYAIPSAEAISFAHDRGIIHRDVKPANILLGDDDLPYVCDFGLVRTVFNDSIVDPSRDVNEGSAPYMSPALASGRVEDTRCDIYAFGATLYEMLTGRPPYEGRSSEDVLRRIREGPPDPVTKINPAADPGLAAIAERCMGRELRDRYSSLHDVVADLKRVSAGEWPMLRRRSGRRARWIVAGFALALIAGLLSFRFGASTRSDSKVALPATAQTTTSYAAAGQFEVNPGSHFSFGFKNSAAGNFTLLDQYGTESNGLLAWSSRSSSARILMNPFASVARVGPADAMPGQIVLHPGPAGEWACIRFTCPGDGKYVVHLNTTTMGREDRGQMYWSIVANDSTLLMGAMVNANVGELPYARTIDLKKGDLLDLVCDPAGTNEYDFLNVNLQIESVDSNVPSSQPLPMPPTEVPLKQAEEIALHELGSQSAVSAVTFSDDGQAVVVGTNDGRITLLRCDTLEAIRTIQCGDEPIRSVQLPHAASGNMLIRQGGATKAARVIDSTSGRSVRELAALVHAHLMRDGWRLVTVNSAAGMSAVRLLNVDEPDLQKSVWLSSIPGAETDLIDAVPFDDESSLLVADEAGNVHILRMADGSVAANYKIEGLGPPLSVVMNGRLILGTVGGLVDAFRISDGKCVQQLGGHVWPVDQVRVNPKKFTACSTDISGELLIWNLGTGARLGRIPFPAKATGLFALSPDGSLAVQIIGTKLHLLRLSDLH